MSVYDVLIDVNAPQWLASVAGGKLYYDSENDVYEIAGHEDDEPFKEAFWRKMLESFCKPGQIGEMYTSAAPYDPLFWVVHPSSDRFLAWRRMLGRHYPDTWALDETWGYEKDWVIGETGMVCDWTGVDENGLDMPNCVKGTCGGHNEFDVLPFTVEINGQRQRFNNAEWMDLIYPTNEELPYMYDKFDWEHCSEDGYDMGTSSS
ncbi:unnamed protein product [Ascophyllum nodosum]